MSVLIIFIKLIAVFDLLVIAVYFGGDILSTMLNKLRRKAKQEDSFDFSQDAVMVSLSIDSVRQLYSGDAADFVEDKILPNAEKTMVSVVEKKSLLGFAARVSSIVCDDLQATPGNILLTRYQQLYDATSFLSLIHI